MFVENLRQFGLNEKEISVYLALISLGPSPARLVAQKAGVNRGTTYDILKGLVALGLAAHYKQYNRSGKKQYFAAEPPRKILNAIEAKKRDLEMLKAQVDKDLPELELLYEKSGAKPVAKYYEGSTGLRIILQDVLLTMGQAGRDKTYFVYSSADIKEYLYKAYPDFNKDRLRAKIANRVVSLGRGGELAGLDERRWMQREHGAPTYILIYNGKVAMISLSAAAEPVGVVIEDEALYKTQKMIFEFIWSSLVAV